MRLKLMYVLVAVLSLIVIGLYAFDIRLAHSVRLYNSVTEISRDGNARYFASGEKFMENWIPPTKVRLTFVKNFVLSYRSVSRNEDENRRNIYKALCACETSRTLPAMQKYFEKNNPYEISRRQYTVVPENEIVVQMYEDNAYKATWREKTYDSRSGALLSDRSYEGIFWIGIFVSENAEAYSIKPNALMMIDLDVSLLKENKIS